jgi:hypothetical protein
MLLPLSGQPQLVVVGREVALGGNYADLIALETTGRPVVVEVKLAQNAEARRAVVAQVLTYAAHLHTLTPAELRDILDSHLKARGFGGLSEAAQSADQSGEFSQEAFDQALAEHLGAGSFRLVLVLDSAPDELVRLVGYLETVSDKLVIDLVTVSAFDVNGTGILVPQRVDPERVERVAAPKPASKQKGELTPGAGVFLEAIKSAPPAEQPKHQRLATWAQGLERLANVNLVSYRGTRMVTLLPRIRPDNVGLVSIWNDGGKSYLSVWRTVFERLALASIPAVEAALSPVLLGKGNSVVDISDELLDVLTAAYEEADRTVRTP